MKKLFMIVALSFALNSYSQKQVFEAPDMKEKIAAQKTVAIIPFQVTINYKKTTKKF